MASSPFSFNCQNFRWNFVSIHTNLCPIEGNRHSADFSIGDDDRHGLQTPNEGINQRYLKNWADVADIICFGRT